jgi:hypothetical protein
MMRTSRNRLSFAGVEVTFFQVASVSPIGTKDAVGNIDRSVSVSIEK